MPSTATIPVSFQKLQARGQSAVTVVKLMMACNDLSLTNQALDEWKKEQPNRRKSRQTGARLYFVRAPLAHLYEALKVIQAIQQDSTLSDLVGRCDNKTQESFKALQQFLPGGSKRDEFERLVGRIRNNLTFHYDESGRLIERAISDRASRPDRIVSSVTRGNTAYLWHFKVADELVDTIVVRQIWNIPKSADLRVEADATVDFAYQLFLRFVDFSGEFIWRFCAD